ncbi:MAG TPA: TetR/AcrR family transcriptional regulator [Solirubrobacterales bacterium]|nr:TetR/AcrR family transcriptional regulator [Solirubrobacterales bacterium]
MEASLRQARGRPSEGAREALVEAAHELFMERDYEQVSTEQILERSGVSRGALYHHFPTKLDLFRAVFVASERRVIDRIAAGVQPSPSPFETLLALAGGYLRAAETDEELRRIGLGQSRAVLGWEGWREVAGELGLGLTRAVVAAAIEAGELPPSDPETLSIVLLGAMIDAAMLIAVAQDRSEARERSEAVIVDLLEGLRR